MRPSTRAALRSVVVLSLVFVLGACGGNSDENASATSTSSTTTIPASKFQAITDRPAIEVVDNEFDPTYATVKVGTTITFTNTGRNDHNVTPSVKGAFTKSADLGTGQTFELKLDKVGDVPYYCTIHGSPTAGQNGVIRVVP